MNSFHVVLYSLAIFTSFGCTVLLYRGYTQRRIRLLMWSAICFACLTVNNVIVFMDLVVYPGIDLRLPRLLAALIGLLFLLYAFIWDTE